MLLGVEGSFPSKQLKFVQTESENPKRKRKRIETKAKKEIEVKNQAS